MASSVGTPQRRGHLHYEGPGEHRAERRAAEADADDRQEGTPRRDESPASAGGLAALGELRGERARDDHDGSPRDERGPVVGEQEVGTPGGVVDAGERGPRPGHPADVRVGERDPQLRNELGDREDAGEDGSEREQLTGYCERVRRKTR